MGRLQVPISRAAGTPWDKVGPDVSIRDEGRASPTLVGTEAVVGSERAGVGLSMVMVPTSKSGRSLEAE